MRMSMKLSNYLKARNARIKQSQNSFTFLNKIIEYHPFVKYLLLLKFHDLILKLYPSGLKINAEDEML